MMTPGAPIAPAVASMTRKVAPGNPPAVIEMPSSHRRGEPIGKRKRRELPLRLGSVLNSRPRYRHLKLRDGYLPANWPKKSKIMRERLQLRRPGRAQGRLDAPLSLV